MEGNGLAVVEDAECPLFALIDEGAADGFQWTYDRSVTIGALGSGTVSVSVLEGRTAPAAGDELIVPLPYAGAGWVLGASGEFSVDERHEAAPVGIPVPFYRGVSGSGTVRILPSLLRCELVDAFEIDDAVAQKARGFVVQNISKVTELSSTFADGTPHTAKVASHLNKASWRIAIPAGSKGLRLWKLYDRFHGRQRARVLIDGEVVGYWYEPSQDRMHRWYVSEFGIPESFVAGKTEIEIAIDPPPGTPLWSVSRLETWAIIDR